MTLMAWKPIATAPKTGKPILVGFHITEGAAEGTFIPFVAMANGADTQAPGYAKPDVWTEIITPKYMSA